MRCQIRSGIGITTPPRAIIPEMAESGMSAPTPRNTRASDRPEAIDGDPT